MGREDLITDNRSKNGTERASNALFLQPIIEGWLTTMSRDHAVQELNKARVPTGPVYTAKDIFSDPQVKARGMLMPINDPEIGEYSFTRTPIHLSKAPELPQRAAPNLGNDTRWVLDDLLGYDDDRIKTLIKNGTVELG